MMRGARLPCYAIDGPRSSPLSRLLLERERQAIVTANFIFPGPMLFTAIPCGRPFVRSLNGSSATGLEREPASVSSHRRESSAAGDCACRRPLRSWSLAARPQPRSALLPWSSLPEDRGSGELEFHATEATRLDRPGRCLRSGIVAQRISTRGQTDAGAGLRLALPGLPRGCHSKQPTRDR
jgi:hypothetical protein